MLCRASNKTGVMQHDLLPGVFVQLLICQVSHEAILWLPLQMTDTLVSCHNSLKDFHGHILISHNNVSVESLAFTFTSALKQNLLSKI
jgi:hypothetical protein